MQANTSIDIPMPKSKKKKKNYNYSRDFMRKKEKYYP